MENASKALIIAGAILLSILLISLGILIFNQAQDTVSNSGMDQAAITAFNNKFLKYEGTQSGSVVKSLINEAIASNADESLPDVTINSKKPGEDAIAKSSYFSASNNYEVSIDSYSGGMVKNIKIQ